MERWIFFIVSKINLSWSLNILLLRVLQWHINTNGLWIAYMLSGKNIFSTVAPNYSELWRGYRILFDVIVVQRWVKEMRRFSRFCIFSIQCVCFATDLIVITFKNFHLRLLLFTAAILQQSNKWSYIKYLVRTQILVHGNFMFEISN